MISAASFATEYRTELEEFAALHFTPNPKHIGNSIVECRYSDDRFRRVFYCPADRLGMRLEALDLQKKDYYIAANTFSGGNRQSESLFTLHNIVIDVDAHDKWTKEEDRLQAIDSLAYFAASDLPTIPNTIVRTGRGLQLWYAIDPLSYKAAFKYDTVRERLISDVEELIGSIPSLSLLSVDPGASHNTAGLFRLPGSWNSKTEEYGSFEIIHDERLNVGNEYRRITAEQIRNSGSKILKMPRGGNDAVKLAQLREGSLLKLRQIRRAAGQQAGEEMRDLFLFCIYNIWMSVLQNPDKAMERVDQFNKGFIAPLADHEIRNYMRTSERKRYALKNTTIIEKLGISQDEQRQIGLFPAGTVKRDSREQLRQDARDRKAERDQHICELFLQGNEQKKIAEKTGCSAATVGRVLRREGYASRREKLHEEICRLVEEGKCPADIAEEFKLSLAAVYDHIRKARGEGRISPQDKESCVNEEILEGNTNTASQTDILEQTPPAVAEDALQVGVNQKFKQIAESRLYKGGMLSVEDDVGCSPNSMGSRFIWASVSRQRGRCLGDSDP